MKLFDDPDFFYLDLAVVALLAIPVVGVLCLVAMMLCIMFA